MYTIPNQIRNEWLVGLNGYWAKTGLWANGRLHGQVLINTYKHCLVTADVFRKRLQPWVHKNLLFLLNDLPYIGGNILCYYQLHLSRLKILVHGNQTFYLYWFMYDSHTNQNGGRGTSLTVRGVRSRRKIELNWISVRVCFYTIPCFMSTSYVNVDTSATWLIFIVLAFCQLSVSISVPIHSWNWTINEPFLIRSPVNFRLPFCLFAYKWFKFLDLFKTTGGCCLHITGDFGFGI